MASGTTPQPIENIINSKIGTLSKIVTLQIQGEGSGFSLILPSVSCTILFCDQYGRMAYIYATSNEITLKNLGETSITPSKNGRNIKLPVGAWSFGMFIISCATEAGIASLTVEAY